MSFAVRLRNLDSDKEPPIGSVPNLKSYSAFSKTFPMQGERLYQFLFAQHSDTIQTQKAHLATANLKKIFEATFDISAVSGFDRMSLRDLSRSTGMSMGAIYSCISKKEDIAVMVADVVRESSQLIYDYTQQAPSAQARIEQIIRFHLYASTLLQPWYFFLFFETRCLPEPQQTDSKNIELGAITAFRELIDVGVERGELHCDNPQMVANMIVVLLEDWYLKPWKNFGATNHAKRWTPTKKQYETQLNTYYQSLTQLVTKLIQAPSADVNNSRRDQAANQPVS